MNFKNKTKAFDGLSSSKPLYYVHHVHCDTNIFNKSNIVGRCRQLNFYFAKHLNINFSKYYKVNFINFL